MDEIKLTFTINEINYIYNVLADKSYKDVSGLIQKIDEQVKEQRETSE